mmetsp:Transcript_16936/g.46359  ORF Transcript_16936/g.46359 Transcript_16936/m.46359 type:complete len:257 (+) Transcript_16936:36-806(+)
MFSGIEATTATANICKSRCRYRVWKFSHDIICEQDHNVHQLLCEACKSMGTGLDCVYHSSVCNSCQSRALSYFHSKLYTFYSLQPGRPTGIVHLKVRIPVEDLKLSHGGTILRCVGFYQCNPLDINRAQQWIPSSQRFENICKKDREAEVFSPGPGLFLKFHLKLDDDGDANTQSSPTRPPPTDVSSSSVPTTESAGNLLRRQQKQLEERLRRQLCQKEEKFRRLRKEIRRLRAALLQFSTDPALSRLTEVAMNES